MTNEENIILAIIVAIFLVVAAVRLLDMLRKRNLLNTHSNNEKRK